MQHALLSRYIRKFESSYLAKNFIFRFNCSTTYYFFHVYGDFHQAIKRIRVKIRLHPFGINPHKMLLFGKEI